MAEELKACPFCGSEEIWFAKDQDNLWSGDCQGCAARSPDSATKGGSIAAWNTRPLEDALQVKLDIARAELENIELSRDINDIHRYAKDALEKLSE